MGNHAARGHLPIDDHEEEQSKLPSLLSLISPGLSFNPTDAMKYLATTALLRPTVAESLVKHEVVEVVGKQRWSTALNNVRSYEDLIREAIREFDNALMNCGINVKYVPLLWPSHNPSPATVKAEIETEMNRVRAELSLVGERWAYYMSGLFLFHFWKKKLIKNTKTGVETKDSIPVARTLDTGNSSQFQHLPQSVYQVKIDFKVIRSVIVQWYTSSEESYDVEMSVEFDALHINSGIVKNMCRMNTLKIQRNPAQELEFEVRSFTEDGNSLIDKTTFTPEETLEIERRVLEYRDIDLLESDTNEVFLLVP
jgi:hypothetical protein